MQYTFYDLLKVCKDCKVLKKFTEANTRKMDTKFACKNPHFDFHAGQFTRDIVFQKSRHALICGHAKAIHALKMTRVALICPRVAEIEAAHWGNSKNSWEPRTLS